VDGPLDHGAVGNRSFTVTPANVTTPQERQPTGLRPGTPSFQHLHLWPANHCLQKVGYAYTNDEAITHADGDGQTVEEVQSKGMSTVVEYLQMWRLNLSTTRAVLVVFTSTTRRINVSWKSTTTTKPCPFSLNPDTSEECSTGLSPTPDSSSHFAKSWHHALNFCGDLLTLAGMLEQQRCEQPPYPGSFNIILLRSCLVQQCSHLPHWLCHQRRLVNWDWIPVSYTKG